MMQEDTQSTHDDDTHALTGRHEAHATFKTRLASANIFKGNARACIRKNSDTSQTMTALPPKQLLGVLRGHPLESLNRSIAHKLRLKQRTQTELKSLSGALRDPDVADPVERMYWQLMDVRDVVLAGSSLSEVSYSINEAAYDAVWNAYESYRILIDRFEASPGPKAASQLEELLTDVVAQWTENITGEHEALKRKMMGLDAAELADRLEALSDLKETEP